MKKNQTAFLKLCLADALIQLMDTQDFDAVNVNAICKHAGIGRTTFYRYFDSKNSKEDLLVFKIQYEWEQYAQRHEDEVATDKGFALTCFVYENRRLFSLLYRNRLIPAMMRAFEALLSEGESRDKASSYLVSYFTYGYFGIIYQWIQYDFDETPQEIRRYLSHPFH